MPDRRGLPAALLTAAVVGMPCAAVTASPAAAAPAAPAAPGQDGRVNAVAATVGSELVDFRVKDDRITESSGLALSVRHPHTVWTANDSGDPARIFAVDTRTGRTVGVHTFGAPVQDVEALAISPQGRMLVTDIGDNESSRKVVRVFWFDEPGLGTTSGTWASWELSYPDGPHNAEAVAVDPTSGRVYVVTKERPGAIYALPAAPSRQGVNRLTKVASAPDIATDAVFLPDGSGLAVRTYTSLVVLDPTTWRPVSSQVLPLQPQGETVALAPDGVGLLVGSEGKRSSVRQVAIASSTTPTSTPTSTSTNPAPTSGPSSGPSSGPLETQGPDGNALSDSSQVKVNRGELVAGLGACAGLVTLAFLIAQLSRRRRR